MTNKRYRFKFQRSRANRGVSVYVTVFDLSQPENHQFVMSGPVDTIMDMFIDGMGAAEIQMVGELLN